MNPRSVRITDTIFAGVLVLFIGSSPSVVAQNNSVNDKVLIETDATVTGQLKTRNYIVTIYASFNGPLYTVIDSDGKMQGVQMPPKLLAQQFPVLKSIIDNPAGDASINNHRPIQIDDKAILIQDGVWGLGAEL